MTLPEIVDLIEIKKQQTKIILKNIEKNVEKLNKNNQTINNILKNMNKSKPKIIIRRIEEIIIN